MVLIQKEENMTKVQVIFFYFELSFKPNVDIVGINVSILKRNDFENIFTFNDVINIQYSVGKGFISR